jgi:hypothetical protein
MGGKGAHLALRFLLLGAAVFVADDILRRIKKA